MENKKNKNQVKSFYIPTIAASRTRIPISGI